MLNDYICFEYLEDIETSYRFYKLNGKLFDNLYFPNKIDNNNFIKRTIYSLTLYIIEKNRIDIMKYMINKYKIEIVKDYIYNTIRNNNFELFKYLIKYSKFEWKDNPEPFFRDIKNISKYNEFYKYLIYNNHIKLNIDFCDYTLYSIRNDCIYRKDCKFECRHKFVNFKNNEALIYICMLYYNHELFEYLINNENINIDIHLIKLAIQISFEVNNYEYIKSFIKNNVHKKYKNELILFCIENDYEFMYKVLEYID